ncbi:MAG: cytochrome c oxidase accessory protein CcoG [Deltaproteobacteria bacterium]|nr:cytochrome c oxidase accessory protein CcoG [Deltaproteobacteria bacterium]
MKRSLPILQDSAPSSIRADGRRVPIFPLDVKGKFITARRIVFALLIALYAGAPLVHVGGHPAIHLDVAKRQFFLMGGTFNAQDFWIVLLLATAAAFALLFITAWRGRMWCGWACPQTVFLEGVFRPIERLLEGPRSRRLKMQRAPWTALRLLRTTTKHVLYLVAAAGVAHIALALFVSLDDLWGMIKDGPVGHAAPLAWAIAITAVLYFNFAWFREQFCVVLCPYGRMQSVLHDQDSIVVAYDPGRGEPRGPLKKAALAEPTGHCVDCKKCVHVCPTAIDIRNGLQMECLACAQCIDVCDEVMEKIGRPKGLIRFASLNELLGKGRRVMRPRLLLYAVLCLLCSTGFAVAVVGRTPFEANILRAPGVPWVLEGANVRNQVDIHLVNKHAQQASFSISVQSDFPASVQLGQRVVVLDSLAGTRVPVVVTVARKDLHAGSELTLRIEDLQTGQVKNRQLRLLAPGVH